MCENQIEKARKTCKKEIISVQPPAIRKASAAQPSLFHSSSLLIEGRSAHAIRSSLIHASMISLLLIAWLNW